MTGGGGGGGGLTESVSQSIIPSQLQPLITEAGQVWQQLAGQAAPRMSELIGAHPEQIPTETGTEANLSDQLTGIAQGTTGTAPQMSQVGWSPLQSTAGGLDPNMAQTDPFNQAAVSQISQLTGGQIGYSPATQAGMQAFQSQMMPQAVGGYSSAAGGGGVGGGLNESQAMATEAASVPLIQQEIANREAGVGQLTNLGAQDIATRLQVPQIQFGQEQAAGQQAIQEQGQQTSAYSAQQQANLAQQQQQQADIQNAMTAAGLPREIATSQAQANQQDYLRQLQGIETALLGPIQTFGQNLMGSGTTSYSSGSGGGGK